MVDANNTLPEGFQVMYTLRKPFGVRKVDAGLLKRNYRGIFEVGEATFEEKDLREYPDLMRKLGANKGSRIVHTDNGDYELHNELLGYNDDKNSEAVGSISTSDLILIQLTPEAMSHAYQVYHDDSGLSRLVKEQESKHINGIFKYSFLDYELSMSGIPLNKEGQEKLREGGFKYLKIFLKPVILLKDGIVEPRHHTLGGVYVPTSYVENISAVEKTESIKK